MNDVDRVKEELKELLEQAAEIESEIDRIFTNHTSIPVCLALIKLSSHMTTTRPAEWEFSFGLARELSRLISEPTK
jgi:hypothetical protein